MKYMNFKRICLIIIALFVLLFVGLFICIKDWNVTENLGNNYVFTSDCGIQYQVDGHNYFIIPFGITSINHDAKWIIAKTSGLNAFYNKSQKQCNDGSQYWIINKDAKIIRIDSIQSSNMMSIKGNEYPIVSESLIGPLDSISFSNKLRKLRIKVTFKGFTK